MMRTAPSVSTVASEEYMQMSPDFWHVGRMRLAAGEDYRGGVIVGCMASCERHACRAAIELRPQLSRPVT